MRRLYLDHAATTHPKPPGVYEAMVRFGRELGASPGRGAYRESIEAGKLLDQCRRRINTLIGGQSPEHVIFTLNCSDALNIAIKGVVRTGDHVVTTQLDHNSILRPLNALKAAAVATHTRVACDPATGRVDPADIEAAITPRTRLIALLHGSNVTGTLQDIAAVGEVARRHQVLLLVDAAQTLGHVPVDVQAMGIDLLAAPGHKGLLGPLGTGLLYIRPGIEEKMTTLREGGTGSVSERDTQPDFMPDRFEPGSHNTIGLAGLNEAVAWVLNRSIEAQWAHERQLIETFLDALREAEAPGVRLYGPRGVEGRCAVFSVRVEGYDDPQTLSAALEQQYGLLTRSGLHCAPGAHATIGTADRGGTTRLSFGPFNTPDDARFAAESVAALSRQRIAPVAGAAR